MDRKPIGSHPVTSGPNAAGTGAASGRAGDRWSVQPAPIVWRRESIEKAGTGRVALQSNDQERHEHPPLHP
jgi:hypothetical protein